MKKLWAPWRVDFLFEPQKKGCIFCSLSKQKKDRENLILYRGRYNFIILNKYPYNNGHLMVVPYAHTVDLSRLSLGTYEEMMDLSATCIQSFEKTIHAQGHNMGMNLGAAGGAGIRGHLHMHIVPRWIGDTNYMPVLGETKVMIEYLHSTYDRLAPEILKRQKKKKRVQVQKS